MFGAPALGPGPRLRPHRPPVLLGANPLVSNGSMWTVPDFRGQGARRSARAAAGSSSSTRAAPRRRRSPTSTCHPPRQRRVPAARPRATCCSTRRSCGSASSRRTSRASTSCSAPVAPFTARGRRRAAAASRPTRSAALARELATTDRAPRCTAASARARSRSARSRSWLVDVSTCSPATSTRPAARCSRKAAGVRGEHASGAPGRGKGMRPAGGAAACRGAPEVFGELPLTLPRRRDRDAGRRPGPRAVHARGNPCCARRTGRASPRRSTNSTSWSASTSTSTRRRATPT